ncbi:hypothetical protein ABPH35_05395 [Streptococcus sp. ZJ93]|uniref:hypothetical protein n=1 Tax=Streptococcus handemini TaxID=3161188 RepID=UPI0032EB62FE
MLICEQELLYFLINTIAEAEIRSGYCKNEFITERYLNDEYYEYSLLNDSSDIVIRFYLDCDDRNEEFVVTLALYDDIHEPVLIKFTFSDGENDISDYKEALKVIIEHYIVGSWYQAMEEIEEIGFSTFVQKNSGKLLS